MENFILFSVTEMFNFVVFGQFCYLTNQQYCTSRLMLPVHTQLSSLHLGQLISGMQNS